MAAAAVWHSASTVLEQISKPVPGQQHLFQGGAVGGGEGDDGEGRVQRLAVGQVHPPDQHLQLTHSCTAASSRLSADAKLRILIDAVNSTETSLRQASCLHEHQGGPMRNGWKA